MTLSDHPALPPGYRLIAREEVGSTNDEARALIAAGAAAGSVVWAQAQTAGRGRHGRQWSSPPGNLYCSTILRPPVDSGRLAEISFVAALGARDAIAAHLPSAIAVDLKWPNDVLAGGRKIAGILVEAEKLPGEDVTALIVGVGVNVASAPKDASYPATCMAAQGRTPPVGVLLSALIAALDRTVDLWLRSGFPEIRRRWMNHAHGLGAEIVASTGVSGVFAGLDDSGAIIIASAAGERHRLVSGSVRYISTD